MKGKKNSFKKIILYLKVLIILLVVGLILPKILNIVLEYIESGYSHRNSMLVNGYNTQSNFKFINIFLKYIFMYFIIRS